MIPDGASLCQYEHLQLEPAVASPAGRRQVSPSDQTEERDRPGIRCRAAVSAERARHRVAASEQGLSSRSGHERCE